MDLTVVGLVVEPAAVMTDRDVFHLFRRDFQELRQLLAAATETMAAVAVMEQLELSLSKVDQLLYKRDRLCLHRFKI